MANYTTDRRGPTVVIFSCHMDNHMNFHEWQITSSSQIVTALFLEINVWIIARSALAMCTGILQDNNWKCSLLISPCKNSCNWSISLSLYNITIFTLILSPMRYKYYFFLLVTFYKILNFYKFISSTPPSWGRHHSFPGLLCSWGEIPRAWSELLQERNKLQSWLQPTMSNCMMKDKVTLQSACWI